MNKNLFLISTGFALFSMFFGSGNLAFPLIVGLESQGNIFLASLGVLCSGVIFPLLGMLGMMLSEGSISNFFSCFGKRGAFLFSFIALALMGPFGVLARCLTVIHGALLPIFPELSQTMTSLIFSVIIYALAKNKNRMITILGSIMTPVLLLSIATIAYFSLNQAPIPESTNSHVLPAFFNGYLKGYQTMDLVASFFFAGFVINQLHQACASGSFKESPIKFFIKASFVSAALLYIVYYILVLLGWRYYHLLSQLRPEEMFSRIALESLGSFATPVICLAVIFACLTTAIALASLFGQFLRKEVSQERIGEHPALIITLCIAFCVSTLEFSGISNFLGPILETMYPALITLTIINIVCKYYGMKSSHWPFTLTLVTKLCWI